MMKKKVSAVAFSTTFLLLSSPAAEGNKGPVKVVDAPPELTIVHKDKTQATLTPGMTKEEVGKLLKCKESCDFDSSISLRDFGWRPDLEDGEEHTGDLQFNLEFLSGWELKIKTETGKDLEDLLRARYQVPKEESSAYEPPTIGGSFSWQVEWKGKGTISISLNTDLRERLDELEQEHNNLWFGGIEENKNEVREVTATYVVTYRAFPKF